jgi:ATP-dependent Clp protease ATP-binding subunit ClpC
MVAGTKYRGEFEQRIKLVIDEASKLENEVIIFIDEIHMIIGAGSGEGSLDAANILKPAMARGKISLIGATTLSEYQKYIEKDSALERRFQKIDVAEPTKEVAHTIITGLRSSFEEFHNLIIDDEAITDAVELSTRYITDRFLPDKAIDLIDEACSTKSMTYNFDTSEVTDLKEKMQ